MLDRFDYASLWEILDRLRATHRIVTFAAFTADAPADPFVILRHDIDYSLDAALAVAEQEAARGVSATYFLLLNGPYYNLFDPRHAHVPARLAALGHEVGLHYDINFLNRFPEARRPSMLRLQANVLEELSGQPVRSIAMHQPGLYGDDPFRGRPDVPFLNAYDDRFFREMTYLSDSCRAWRDSAWSVLTSDRLPARLQLLLHPINWGTRDRDRTAIFSAVHGDLVREIESAGRELLEHVERHRGVVEHEIRVRASAGRPPEPS